jgi:hypothetical protein
MPLTCIPGSVLCGLGLPEILLWVLVFAIVFGILSVIKIFGDKGKKINALIALVIAFFVLMSAPLSVMTVISSLSNSFVVLAVTLIVLMAFIYIALGESAKGTWDKYARWVALALVLIAILVFMGAGGIGFIGIGTLPAIAFNVETIGLILVGIAVLWMIFGKDEQPTKV